MGTKQSRIAKLECVKAHLAKSKESKKGFPRKIIVAKLMINFACLKRTAEEIVQAFIDSNQAEEIEENGELMIYG